MIFAPTREILEKAARLIRQGDVVAFPTETVYGLGADATSNSAVKKIFDLKGRPSNNPLIVHLSSFSEIERYFQDLKNDAILLAVKKLSTFWPGPLTVVVPKSDRISHLVTGGGESVGLRIPQNSIAKTLIELAGVPIAAPSANKSQEISSTTAENVLNQLGDKVSMIIDGGHTQIGLESTVVSLMDPSSPIILRPGAITPEQISRALSTKVLTDIESIQSNSDSPALPSPGLLEKHYAPRTPTKFLASVDLWSLPHSRIGLLAFREGLHLDFDFAAIRTISTNCKLSEVAHNLYSALSELDHLGLDIILVDSCSETGLGIAIMDRLRRATSMR